jgi:PKMT, C-terminal winged helix domain
MLNDPLKILAPHLDGKLDRPALLRLLSDALRSGKLKVSEITEGQQVEGSIAIEAMADRLLNRSLSYLAVNAMLESGSERD